jgi:hypothetical protein
MVVSTIRVMLWLGFAASLGAFVALFAARVELPGPATPVETVIRERVLRLNSELPLYADVEPAVPGIPPVFPGISAVGYALLGSTRVIPRILTLLAMLAAAFWLAAIVKRETSSWTCGVTSAGLLLAGYGLLGGPLGVARTEPLMLLLLLAGGDALLRGRGVPGAMWAGALFSLAALTHGAALAVAALVLLHLAAHQRTQALGFATAVAIVYGGTHVAMSTLVGPWFNYDMWDAVILRLAFDPLSLLRHVGQTLLGPLDVLALTTLMALALPVKPWQGPGGTWICIGGGLLFTALIVTQIPAAGPAAAILSVMALALVGPLSMQRVTRHLAAWPGSTRMSGQSMVLTALALQFVALASRMPPPRFGP